MRLYPTRNVRKGAALRLGDLYVEENAWEQRSDKQRELIVLGTVGFGGDKWVRDLDELEEKGCKIRDTADELGDFFDER